PEALEREADLRLGRELRADAARGLARRAAAHRFPLEDKDIAYPEARQMIGDTAAHHATSDDDDACGPGRVHGSDRPRDPGASQLLRGPLRIDHEHVPSVSALLHELLDAPENLLKEALCQGCALLPEPSASHASTVRLTARILGTMLPVLFP